MVVAAVLDGEGHPVCCELWPGNTTDTKTLLPVVEPLRGRFGIRSICIVADRGMVSEEVIAGLGAAARDDGKWVLRTDTDLGADEVALKYKELWQVERLFRSVKSLLATRGKPFRRWE